MGFIKSYEGIAKVATRSVEFYDAEMLTVSWETKPEIVELLLPPPLIPTARPFVTAFIAHYPRTNFGPECLEGGLFLRSEFNGEVGNYCLAMPVTDDMAMASGREFYGFPKKMANIELRREGNSVDGCLERHAQRFFEIHANLTGKQSSDDFLDTFNEFSGSSEGGAIFYLFKHFPAPDGSGFDYKPRLVRQEAIMRPNLVEFGEAEIVLKPSETDPWHQVEILKILGAVFTVSNNSLIKGDIIAEVDPIKFAPYSFIKWDW